MRYELNIQSEPFETHLEFDEESEIFETELADLEWEEEAGRRRRPRPAVSRARRGGQVVSTKRLIKSPVRPPIRPPLPPIRPPRPVIFPTFPWPPVSVVEPRPPQPPAPAGAAEPKGAEPAPAGGSPTPPSVEPSAEGSEHVRWVQDSLNRILGLRLPLDGVMGPEVRSAVRSFQERQGLPITGLVGPDTERALIAAISGQSPGAGAAKPAESGMTEPSSPAAEFDFEWENFDDGGELDFPEFESPAEIAQKKVTDFREKVHLRSQDHRKLLLAARLHPFPQGSLVIMRYPVNAKEELITLIIEAYGFQGVEYDWILDDLKRVADRKFGPEIAAEEKLVVEAAKVIAYTLKKELKTIKPILLEAAMLDQKDLETNPGALGLRFFDLGARLAGRLSMHWIIESEASEAHLVRLGWRLAEYANNLRKKDRAFKNEVDQERRRRQLQQQQERKRRSRKRN